MKRIKAKTFITIASMLLLCSCFYSCEKIHTRKYVDLALPSGTLWAESNIGAKSPEEFGEYFCFFDLFYEDNPTWNGTGATPTLENWEELIAHCSGEWTSLNGVNGYRFTGSNGNSIFLPAAGCGDTLYSPGCQNKGCYWSSTENTSHFEMTTYLFFFCFSQDGAAIDTAGLKAGPEFSVRPVRSGKSKFF